MTSLTSDDPKQADLTNCDREPIHIPGAIQPHGCLLVCSMPDWFIEHASRNAPDILGKASLAEILNHSLEKVLPHQTVHDLRNILQSAMVSGTAERLPNADIGSGAGPHDLNVHMSGGNAIIEIFPQNDVAVITADAVTLVRSMIGRLKRAPNTARFLQMAAQQVRAVTGYDRVMIYKFLKDSSGQVMAEAVRAGLSPFMGLRYPASDIPAQARELYKRQWLRIIPDADYKPVPLEPQRDVNGNSVDLGLASLRSVSPIHIEYMRNMGVQATLTVSLMRGDELWGLIACHHDSPRHLSASTCAAAELFGQVLSLQIEAKEQEEELTYASRSRQIHDRLLSEMTPEETIFDNIGPYYETLQELIPCDGVGVWTNDRFLGHGMTPPADAIDRLIEFLNRQSATKPYATKHLGKVLPTATLYADRVSGLLAIPFARNPRDYLIIFRQEVEQTIAWGGNPNKAIEALPGRDKRISPRKSFDAWREKVRGQSIAWNDGELRSAEMLRVSLLEVILLRADITNRERKTAQESQTLLVEELNHRVKNILTLIGSLVRQSRQGAKSLDAFVADIDNRIRALASAHDQMTRTGWNAAPLRGLMEMEALPWTQKGKSSITFNGPPALLDARAYQAVALVLHEMMTNAAKYGALLNEEGTLDVSWDFEPNGDLKISWSEKGGPAVHAPKRRGFGTIVTERTIPFELKGETKIEFKIEGLQAKFLIPALHVTMGAHQNDAPLEKVIRVSLNNTRLLLVEDSMMIALDAQHILQNAGAEVEIVGTTADARRALKLGEFDAAVLDINLSGETSFGIADDLIQQDRPFIFATGYGESIAVPSRFQKVPIVTKPYDDKSLRAALARSPGGHLHAGAE